MLLARGNESYGFKRPDWLRKKQNLEHGGAGQRREGLVLLRQFTDLPCMHAARRVHDRLARTRHMAAELTARLG